MTNGLHLYPEPPYTSGGPDKLFRNLGNAYHWAEFDLRGTVSNRDGIGATVIVTAGGKTQRREANGGYKRWAQNDRRLHFGLGPNSTMNVSVRWPSGTVNNYANVPADRLYEAVEGGAALVPIDIGTPPDPPDEVPVTQWINATGGVSTAGNSVSYSGAGGGWNAHTVNSAPLSMFGATDEYKVEFTVGSNPAGTTWVLGFGITETEAGWRDVDFGLRSVAGALSIVEGGNWVVNLGNLAIGDRLGIAINGTLLEYRRNGVTVRSRTITPQDFYIDSSFKAGAILLENFLLSDD